MPKIALLDLMGSAAGAMAYSAASAAVVIVRRNIIKSKLP
jgi:hypothetical protein